MALKRTLFLLLALLQLFAIDQVVTHETIDDAAQGFAKKLFKQLFTMNGTNNFVVSPSAIQRQLLLAMQGAHGETYNDIKKLIELDGFDEATFVDVLAKKPTEYVSSDFIYKSPKVKLRMPFKLLGKLLFDVSPDELDFENVNDSADEINHSMEEQTNGLVKKIIKAKELNPQTAICYVNSALFGGQWLSPFHKKMNRIATFSNYGNSLVTTSFLYDKKRVGYADLSDLKAKAVSISYMDTDKKLLILLPKESSGLNAMFEKAMRADFALLIRKLKTRIIDMSLPKFSIDYRVKLSNVMEQLESKTLFTPNADFENTFENPVPPNEPCMYSKAHFDVDDDGSSTDNANLVLKSEEQQVFTTPDDFFDARHPFIFFIHSNETIHFFGRVVALNVAADISAEDIPTVPPTTADDD